VGLVVVGFRPVEGGQWMNKTQVGLVAALNCHVSLAICSICHKGFSEIIKFFT